MRADPALVEYSLCAVRSRWLQMSCRRYHGYVSASIRFLLAHQHPDLQGNHILKTVRFRIDLDTIGMKHQTTPQVIPSTSSSSSGDRSSSSELPSRWNKHVTNVPAPRMAVDSGSTPTHSSTIPTQIHGSSHSATPLCVVTFMQEKGAYSMLKVIHQRIQQSWM
jgi:hypothetical protein